MVQQAHHKVKFLKKIQELNIFWRKFILFGIIIFLGIGLGFLFVKNFKNTLGRFEKDNFWKGLNIQNLKEEIEESERLLQEHLKKIEEMTEQISSQATSTTSTNSQ